MSLEFAMNAWGWALLNFVWQGAVIGAGAALLLGLLRGASARWRYAVCAASLGLCLGLPLAQCLDLAPADVEFTGELPAVLEQLPALVTAWALGTGLMLARLALGLAWVHRARRRSTPAPAQWQARLDALARGLGLRRAVGLRLLPELSGPITVGMLRPCVLLPAALLSRLPVDLLEALLAHELAHVRRWDYLANLLQSAVEALFFFHPVVWWLSARMRAERELVADEISAALLGDSRRLALALHALSELQPHAAPAVALAAGGGDLLRRIERLLAPKPQATGWKLALPALLIAATSFVVQAKGRDKPDTPEPTAVTATGATPADASPAQQLRLPVNAKHVVVIDDATGKVLMARNADAVVPIASLTKLLTAMVVLDAKLDPNEKLRITDDDVDTLKHSRSRVRVGTQMSRQAALEMALMASENRAAAALARTFPGGEAGFVKAVNAKIRALGLSRTSIAEPTGLSPSNTSTATEMAAITAAAARYGEIERITSVKKAKVPVDGRQREIRNTNRLVGAKGWNIRVSKTGYTEEAGRCLAMRIMNGKRPVTVVLLDADGSANRLRDAALIRKSLARRID
ncbi:D-alanyl-D-alanine endopeptidase (penicillin-binding protein 7) [Pelomonas aquatica]|uniref:D-alanyl-D-alanine endopeptidase (Penicillin-binding protein 7) n=1 Tax=Pelomonas aquatica TaxID=431058 RepID=A0ABU1ZET6_9BURK|nr:M56 family metallopeptidase [Pelomonas aquatica]MDR7299140.1 D-alanyl-D-alanine endopeptidase (penicillin-binding protein 7) [Pelomonas aquatica]